MGRHFADRQFANCGFAKSFSSTCARALRYLSLLVRSFRFLYRCQEFERILSSLNDNVLAVIMFGPRNDFIRLIEACPIYSCNKRAEAIDLFQRVRMVLIYI